MRIEIGAVVDLSGGKEAGIVHKVVIDPHQKTVTHLVIETGFLFGRLIVVPMQAVGRANRHKVCLNMTEGELHQMPDFVETEYAAPPQGWVIPFSYPPGSVLWPGGYVNSPVVVEQERNIPQDSLEVNLDTEVFALDGKIGTVEQVVVDQSTGEVGGFMVRVEDGASMSAFVPIAWVAAAGGGRLSLNRIKAEVTAPTSPNS